MKRKQKRPRQERKGPDDPPTYHRQRTVKENSNVLKFKNAEFE